LYKSEQLISLYPVETGEHKMYVIIMLYTCKLT